MSILRRKLVYLILGIICITPVIVKIAIGSMEATTEHNPQTAEVIAEYIAIREPETTTTTTTTTKAPQTAPSTVSREYLGGNVEQWRPLCERYFPDQTENCLKIMKAESGGNPTAYSYNQDAGLMQINTPTWCRFFGVTTEDLFDPETNMKLARVIYERAGNSWRPWTTSRNLGI